RLRWIFVASLAFGMVWPLFVGSWSFLAGIGAFLGLWIIGSSLKDLVERLLPRAGSSQTLGTRARRLGRSYVGMQFAHIGVALVVIGITFVLGYDDERDVRMAVGETVEVGGYGFRLDALERIQGPNFEADQATVAVYRDGQRMTTLRPQMREYYSQDQPMAQTSLHRGFFRDLYVNMGEPLPGDAWVMRVYYKPFMNWVWAGAILMGLGGFLAATDRRYRVRVRREEDLPEAPERPSAKTSTASA
ncbi:cytochrome c-type biogenesis CcmF C-terminal domain-containing protein, partial [Thioalkalivibrio sp.]|uniref:cytochrome c-type biogenesis CcmF C-terminal domain-containing protein n=1 Tax=Thioalkalivibrio sp. TaxID=2093813 RepID=UPI0039763397